MAETAEVVQGNALPKWLLKVDDVGSKPRVFQYHPRLAEMLNMVPCDEDGNRMDIKGQDPGDVMQVELKALRAKVKQLETEPAQTVVSDLRNTLALREKQIGELRSELAQAKRQTATTVQVAGEVEGGDPPDDLYDALDEHIAAHPDDKVALETWANDHAQISLDRRKNYDALVEEVREALRAAVE